MPKRIFVRKGGEEGRVTDDYVVSDQEQVAEGEGSDFESMAEAFLASDSDEFDDLDAGPTATADLEVDSDSFEGSEQESGQISDAELAEQYKIEVERNYDKYLRAVAELENYKKRAMKERSEILRYAGENVARDILEVLDDLERALAHPSYASTEELINGIGMIQRRFVEILAHHSIKPNDAIGSPFDPAVQEALATVPSDEHPPGVVIEQLRKSYFFKDKLLRPGQVVVSAAKQ